MLAAMDALVPPIFHANMAASALHSSSAWFHQQLSGSLCDDEAVDAMSPADRLAQQTDEQRCATLLSSIALDPFVTRFVRHAWILRQRAPAIAALSAFRLKRRNRRLGLAAARLSQSQRAARPAVGLPVRRGVAGARAAAVPLIALPRSKLSRIDRPAPRDVAADVSASLSGAAVRAAMRARRAAAAVA
jgi:hypothetical protein